MAEDMRVQYERVMKLLKDDTADLDDVKAAVWHILRRLGPPEPLDGIEAEKLTDGDSR